MIIEQLTITGSYRYFWLKTVNNVKLDTHCSYCLVGVNDRRVVTSGELRNLDLKDSVYYMCGVSAPYVWENNFHLAFMPSPGSRLEVFDEEKGVEVIIRDAVSLPISEEYVDPNDPNIGNEKFRTCRNWQFAHYFAKYLKKPSK